MIHQVWSQHWAPGMLRIERIVKSACFLLHLQVLFMLLELELLSFIFLLVYKGIIDSIVQISIVVLFILPVQVSTEMAELDYLGSLGLQHIQDLLGPIEKLRVVFVIVCV